jgi:hypothetical protein
MFLESDMDLNGVHNDPDSNRKLTIFVDIDGVLNTEAHLRRQVRQKGRSTIRNWCPTAMAHLKLVVEYYNGQIVVSSTWRYDHSLRQLKSLFEDNGLPGKYVVDVTPSLIYENSGKVTRGDEIRRWIHDNLDSEEFPRYVILDDMDEGLSPFGERFIHCDPKVGFADKEKVKQIAKLV